MIFKYLLRLSLSLATAGILMMSCDKVEEPFTRKITIDTTTQEHQKKVLLEDYTGHTCVNCPDAALIARNLKNNLGDRLVVIAVHAGWFANPTPTGDFTDDFRTETGNAWDATFGISNVGNPNGLVNRKNYPSDHILSPAGWSGAVMDALDEPVLVDLRLENEYDTTTRQLATDVTVEFVQDIDKNLNLIVVITESGIIAPQKNNNPETGPTPIIYDYVHNDMLRASINSVWGTPVAAAGTANPVTLKKSFTHTLSQNYNAANCAVVAFVYDTDTKEVLQVVEKELE